MKLENVEQVLLDLKGRPIPTGDSACSSCGRMSDPRDLTLQDVLVTALTASLQDEDGKKKFRKYRIAEAVMSGGEEGITLSAADVTFVKDAVAVIFGPLIVGRVWQLLDPDCKE